MGDATSSQDHKCGAHQLGSQGSSYSHETRTDPDPITKECWSPSPASAPSVLTSAVGKLTAARMGHSLYRSLLAAKQESTNLFTHSHPREAICPLEAACSGSCSTSSTQTTLVSAAQRQGLPASPGRPRQ